MDRPRDRKGDYVRLYDMYEYIKIHFLPSHQSLYFIGQLIKEPKFITEPKFNGDVDFWKSEVFVRK